MTVEMRLMGRFLVLADGREIDESAFGGRKVRALLRVLASHSGQFVPNDVLTEALWPDRPPADPAANLQVLVNRARKAIGSEVIRTGPGGYAVAAVTVDTETFLTAVARATTLAELRSALNAISGEPLPEDTYAEWAVGYRARIRRARQDAWERAADLALTAGESRLAVGYATSAADSDPLREIAVLTLVRALAATGDRAAALARYEQYRRDLAADLGLDPSPAAAELHRRLLVAAPGPADVFRALPFVGRDTVLSRAVIERAAGAVRIAGGSGTGKSRLLEAIAAGVPAIGVAASWAERDEPWSLARSLMRALIEGGCDLASLPERLRAAVADLLPEWSPPDQLFDAETRNAMVVEAARRLVRQRPDRAVLIDDVQWSDPSSARLIGRIAAEHGLILAYRPDELPPATADLLARLPGGPPIVLDALPDSALSELVADRALAAALRDGTDRTPMAVTEVLRTLHAEGLIEPSPDGPRWQACSPMAASRAAEAGRIGQRRAISARAAAQSASARTVLDLLALVGREVPARLLAGATGMSEPEVLGRLDRLVTAELVRLGGSGWRTAHDMVTEVVVASLSSGIRARHHAQLAGVLDADHADAAEQARHWLGAGDTARAAQAYARAAAQALDQYADAEADRLADAGLALSTGAGRAPLLEIRAQARRRQGHITDARDDLRAALDGYPAGPARSGVLAALAAIDSGADDMRYAAELAELALVEAGSDDRARAVALETAAVIDMNLARPDRATERYAEALTLFTRIGDSRGAARILDARAMYAFLHLRIADGSAELDRAARLFESAGDLMRMVTPRSTAGHGLVLMGRAADGLSDTERALDAARTLGQPEGQAYALWHRSEARSALGEPDAALADGREALQIAERLGHRGWTATAWRAIGLAHATAGDPESALGAFRCSLERSANLDLFTSWAAARAGLACIALDRLDEADGLISRALITGPALGRHEARWAASALAVARGDDDAAVVIRDAIDAAEAAGARIYLPELRSLER